MMELALLPSTAILPPSPWVEKKPREVEWRQVSSYPAGMEVLETAVGVGDFVTIEESVTDPPRPGEPAVRVYDQDQYQWGDAGIPWWPEVELYIPMIKP